MDRYAELRAALDTTKFWNNGNGERFSVDTENWGDAANPISIRALLEERDKFFFALQEISHPEAVRGDATKIARAVLAQEQGEKT